MPFTPSATRYVCSAFPCRHVTSPQYYSYSYSYSVCFAFLWFECFVCGEKSQEDAPITYSTPNSEWDILASYEAGSIIDIDVVFTNYHWVST